MGVEGVFVLVPPNFDPAPGFPEARSRTLAIFVAHAVIILALTWSQLSHGDVIRRP